MEENKPLNVPAEPDAPSSQDASVPESTQATAATPVAQPTKPAPDASQALKEPLQQGADTKLNGSNDSPATKGETTPSESKPKKSPASKQKRQLVDTAKLKNPKASKTSKSGVPTYNDMIRACLIDLADKKGSSIPAMKKWILSKWPQAKNATFDSHFKKALKTGVQKQTLIKVGVRYKFNMQLQKKAALLKDREKRQKAQQLERKKKREAKEREKKKLRKAREDKKAKQKKSKIVKLVVAKPPPPLQTEHELPLGLFVDIVQIAEFFRRFSDVLEVSQFSAKMMQQALSESKLLPILFEPLFKLLELKLNSEAPGDHNLKKGGWRLILNGLTWEEILRRYLMRSMRSMGTRLPYKAEILEAASRLEKEQFISIPLESKVRVLKFLIDDVLELPILGEKIDQDLAAVVEAGRLKFHADVKDNKEFRELIGKPTSTRKKKPTKSDAGSDVEEEGENSQQESEQSDDSSDDDEADDDDDESNDDQSSDEDSDDDDKSKSGKSEGSQDDADTKSQATETDVKSQATDANSKKSEKSTKSSSAELTSDELQAKQEKLKKAKEDLKQKKLKREQEYIRKYEFGLRHRGYRLGRDKRRREYWLFDADQTRLYVSSPALVIKPRAPKGQNPLVLTVKLKPEGTSVTDRAAEATSSALTNSNDAKTSAGDVEMQPPPSSSAFGDTNAPQQKQPASTVESTTVLSTASGHKLETTKLESTEQPSQGMSGEAQHSPSKSEIKNTEAKATSKAEVVKGSESSSGKFVPSKEALLRASWNASKKDKVWGFYNTVEEVDQLIKSLDKKIPREALLLQRLRLFYEQITKRMARYTPATLEKMKEVAAKAAAEEEAKRKAEEASAQAAEEQKASEAAAKALELELNNNARRSRPKRSAALSAITAIKEGSSTKVPRISADQEQEKSSKSRKQQQAKVPTFDEYDENVCRKYTNELKELAPECSRPRTLEPPTYLREVDGQDPYTSLWWVASECSDLGLFLLNNGVKISEEWFERIKAVIKTAKTLTSYPDDLRNELGKLLVELELASVTESGEVKVTLQTDNTGEEASDEIEKEWRRVNCENDPISDNIIGLKITHKVQGGRKVDGEITEYFPSDDPENEPHMWSADMDNGLELFFDEQLLRKALIRFLDTHDASSDESSDDDSTAGGDSDSEFMEVVETAPSSKLRIWRNVQTRLQWLASVDCMETLSATAFVAYAFSVRVQDYITTRNSQTAEREKERTKREKERIKRVNQNRAALPYRSTGKIVWAKVKGFPIWPAEEVTPTGKKTAQNMCMVVFLASNDTATVSRKHIYEYSPTDSLEGPVEYLNQNPDASNASDPQVMLKLANRVARIRYKPPTRSSRSRR